MPESRTIQTYDKGQLVKEETYVVPDPVLAIDQARKDLQAFNKLKAQDITAAEVQKAVIALAVIIG